MSKYNNKKTQIDMFLFDSVKEARRYKELALLERAGEIQNLELQPRFLLQEGFKKNNKKWRKLEYVADFKYIENGKTIIEDVKSGGINMKKQITVYFEPATINIEVENNLEEREIEEEINRQIYDIQTDDIINKTFISYWE